jgi:hypothetical protein
MSAETRQWVCDQLVFTDDTQKADLLNADPATGTQTNLIAFLQELLTARGGVWQGGKLEVTAVRTDHPTPDGPNGHEGGNAVDFAPVTDDADLHLIQDVQACVDARGIGLGGYYQQFADACGGYSEQSKLFPDNVSPHIHVQVVGY